MMGYGLEKWIIEVNELILEINQVLLTGYW
jgi:hypothetical protein